MDEPLNPYAAPPTVLERPVVLAARGVPGRVRYWSAQSLAVVLVAGSVPAAAFGLWDIESIVVSGLIFLPASIILAILAMPSVFRMLIGLSIAMTLMIVGCFLTIYLNNWSPTDAQQPISYATVGCAAILQLGWIPIVLVHFRYHRSRQGDLLRETSEQLPR